MNTDDQYEYEEYSEDCPYCDGEGWDEDACDCMEGCIACVRPSGMPCLHCAPQKQPDKGLQDVLANALKEAKK